MSRPSADAALQAVASDGVIAEKNGSVLDGRCRCGALLVRILATPAGLLAVVRRHQPPMMRHLAAKGRQWDGRAQPARTETIVRDGMRTTRIADPVGVAVGWWDDPAWLTDPEPHSWPTGTVDAPCRCGRRLTAPPGEIPRLLRSAVGAAVRSLDIPDDMLGAPHTQK